MDNDSCSAYLLHGVVQRTTGEDIYGTLFYRCKFSEIFRKKPSAFIFKTKHHQGAAFFPPWRFRMFLSTWLQNNASLLFLVWISTYKFSQQRNQVPLCVDSLVSSLPTPLFCHLGRRARNERAKDSSRNAHVGERSWPLGNEVWIVGKFLKIIIVAGKITFS